MRVLHNISAEFDDPNLIGVAGLVPVTAATSSGVPTRPNGLWARRSSPPSPASLACCRSLLTKPGATEATAIPWGASASAMDWPNACSPALAAP